MSILKLVDIKKNYIVDKAAPVQALKKVSLTFDKNGFVGILGPSGCGKTTLLNILGGLDNYSSGDLLVDDVSTKKFTAKDWDNYRNKRVGIIFQQYNLIPHLNVLKNVELPLTLAGVSSKEREAKARFALEQVGLGKEIRKKPNQLSGGQMQRVAIARAIVSNPHIILCDEPTGALDTETSVVVLDILKELSKNHLIIMVTHNERLADKYCDRIIKMLDGQIIDDNEINKGETEEVKETNLSETKEIDTLDLTSVDVPLITETKPKKKGKKEKSRMGFTTSVSLSGRNLWTKKGRTIMVSIAGSIGIVGVSMVLALQNGFNQFMDRIVTETLSNYPLTVEKYSLTTINVNNPNDTLEKNPDDGSLHITYPDQSGFVSNNLTPEYIEYVNNIKNEDIGISSIQYNYALNTTVVTTNDVTDVSIDESKSKYKLIDTSPSGGALGMVSSSSVWKELPGEKDFILSQYEVIEGKYPENANEVVVLVDSYNRISSTTLEALGFSSDSSKMNELSDLVGTKEYKMYPNGVFYTNNAETFKPLEGETNDDAYERLKETYPSSYVKGLKLKRTANFSNVVNTLNKLTNTELSEEDKQQILGELLLNFETRGFVNKDTDGNITFDQSKVTDIPLDHLNVSYNSRTDEQIDELWNSENEEDLLVTGKPIKVVGVLRPKSLTSFTMLTGGVYYTPELTEIAAGTPDGVKGAYEKEKLEAQSNNIEVFGETRADGTVATGTGDLRLYNENADYVLQDDLSDNLYLTFKDGYSLADRLVETLGLDENNFTDKALIDAMRNLEENFTEKNKNALIEKLVLYSFAGSNTNVKQLLQILQKLQTNQTLTSEDKTFITNIGKEVLDLSQLQIKSVKNVNGVSSVDVSSYLTLRQTYGVDNEVNCITIYPKDFDNKDLIIKYLDKWNELHPENKVYYTDIAGTVTSMISTIVNVISIILVIFASVSLLVSSVMIGIITYVSVIERKKEIGILRAIGARKKDVGLLFIAESTIIGFFAGLIGILITYIVEIPINICLGMAYPSIGLGMIADLSWYLALLMVAISMFLTFIAGLFPSYVASKKHPVECLRSE